MRPAVPLAPGDSAHCRPAQECRSAGETNARDFLGRASAAANIRKRTAASCPSNMTSNMWSDLKNWDGGGGGGGVGRWSLGCLVSEMPGAVAVVAQFPPTSRSPTTRREAVDDPFGCRTYLTFVLDFCLFCQLSEDWKTDDSQFS